MKEQLREDLSPSPSPTRGGEPAAPPSLVGKGAGGLGELWGWYLYGIARRSDRDEGERVVGPGVAGGAPARMLPQGDLVAVVSPVLLAEFSPDAVQARARDAAWLEAVVRDHERVVEAVQGERGVLPARFGCVYATVSELAAALEGSQAVLLAQLERLDGCDEWGVRLYADRSVVRQRVAAENPAVRQLQQELASARPGRAYFLQRQVADALAAAAEQALGDLAQAGYDHLARWAVAGQVSARSTQARQALDGETEILRAAFLVRREGLAHFQAEMRRFAESQEGLRCAYSGPWPPYSFAAVDAEVVR